MFVFDAIFFLLLVIWAGVFAIGVFSFIFWILMLIDALQRNFAKSEEKIVWVLVIIFTHFIGAIIYYFIIKRPSDSKPVKVNKSIKLAKKK